MRADDDLLRRVKRRAAQRGISVAQLVRDALERTVGEDRLPPKPLSLGRFDSGGLAPASDADGFVAEPCRQDVDGER